MSAETRTARWAPVTDPQWRPRHLDQWFSNLSWGPPTTAYFVCLPHLTLLIQLISSLVESARLEMGVAYERDIQNVWWLGVPRTGLRTTDLDGHRDKTTVTRWVLCTIWLFCSMEQTAGSSGQKRTGSRLSLVSPKVFFSILSLMEFWFLAAVASGLHSWGHLISSDIVDLITQILFKLNWAGRWHHWIQ